MSIEPIPFGFRVIATKANLVWISKPFFSADLTLRAEFYTEAGQMLDFIDIHLTADQYAAKGTDKWSRATQILAENDVIVISEQEEIMPQPQTDVI